MAKSKQTAKPARGVTVPLLVHFPREMRAAMLLAYGSRGIAPKIRELVARDLIAQGSKGTPDKKAA